MAFLDRFFKPAKRGAAALSPENAIAALQEVHAKIQQEREEKHAIILAHAEKRRELLLADAPTEQILRHDVETDRARIDLERLDEAETEIVARIEFEDSVIADGKWREFYDQWRRLAVDYLEALQAAHGAQQAFLAHHETATGEFARALQLGRVPAVHPGGLAALDHIHANEMARRGRMDRYIDHMRAKADA
ncbi:MAG TPA: hypothetical protein VIF88_03755 [Methylocystis sp.]|jgi:hypothetical protein